MNTRDTWRAAIALLGGVAMAATLGGCLGQLAPAVTSTSPFAGATDVAVNSMVSVTFSEEMDPATINTASFVMARGETPVSGTVRYHGFTATFSPTTPLAAETLYTATMTASAEALNPARKSGGDEMEMAVDARAIRRMDQPTTSLKAGNGLTGDHTWSFRTGAPPDIEGPAVTTTAPNGNAINVSRDIKLSVVFNEAMDPASITPASVTLMQGTALVPATVTYTGFTAVLDPATILASYTLYTVRVSTDARDLAGNALIADYVWRFNTGDTPDTTAPLLVTSLPVDGEMGLPINNNVVAVFDEWMDPLTVNTATFTLRSGIRAVPGTVAFWYRSATFYPAEALSSHTLYTAAISTGVTDLAGNALAQEYVWTFMTADVLDTTAPAVVTTYPEDGATGASLNRNIVVSFSEAMDPLTVSTATFSLREGDFALPGAVLYGFSTGVFDPASDLAPNTTYTAMVTTGARDLAGNALEEATVWSFSTGSAPDATAPLLLSVEPAMGDIGVPINTLVSATFNEAMDPVTLTAATFSLRQGTTAVLGAVSYAGDTAFFVPVAGLVANTGYTANVRMEAADLAGNRLEMDAEWSFTTGNTKSQALYD